MMKAMDMLGAFQRPELLNEALTHRSMQKLRKNETSNERLEFLGDRVLNLLITEYLIGRYKTEDEGDIGRRFAYLTSTDVLAKIADQISLSDLIKVFPGEAKAGAHRRETVLADALEAVIGALYLDRGINRTRKFVLAAWSQTINAQVDPPRDAKTALQERVQSVGWPLPTYAVTAQHGPAHAPTFVVTAQAAGESASGEGNNRRQAEQAAAKALLATLDH